MHSYIAKLVQFVSLISLLSFSACAQSSVVSVSKDDWKEDLAVYESTLRKHHIDLFHTISEEFFSTTLVDIAEDYNEQNYEETLVKMMKLTRQIGDGHTTFPLWGSPVRHLPIQFTYIANEYYITGAPEEHKNLLGSKLVAVNSVTKFDLEKKIGRIVPFVENKHSERVRVAANLQNEIVLKGVGVVKPNENSVEFDLVKDELPLTASFTFLDQGSHASTLSSFISYRNVSDFEIITTVKDRLWFAQHQSQPTILINFGNYPNFDEANELGLALIDHIRTNNIENLIIDLRDNYGGDFFMGLNLASYLNLADSIDWKSGVFVLANGKTFSAAMSNTSHFKEILNARVVGQPTGASPCGYQDMGSFVLPNSKLEVTYSKRKFCFEHSKTNAIEPDFPIQVSIEDYIQSRDVALDWIISSKTQ